MNKKYIGLAVLLGLLIAGGYSYMFPPQSGIGGDLVAPIAGQTYTLSGSGMSSSDTSFTLSSLTITQNGYAIQDSDVSDTFYLTIEPGSRSRQEIISCTTIGTNTGGPVLISGCVRGLSPITPYTASTSLAFAHSGGSTVIFSDAPQLFNQAGFKDNDETVTGSWLFPTPLANENAATKAYVDALVNGGTVSNDRLVVAGTAGETMATGTLIYFNGTTQRWNKVNAASSTTFNDRFIGLSQGPGTNGSAVSGGILLKGRDVTQTGLSAGSIYYAATGTATGTITTNASGQTIGIAVSATVLYFDPVWIDVPHENGDNIFTGTNTFTGIVNFPGTTTVRVYTSASTAWVKPTNVRYITVVVCGAGGNGSAGSASLSDAGGGGGAGGCGFELLDSTELTATTSVLVTVGTTAASNSSFGTFCTATGGTTGAIPTAGTGGTASGCDINIDGQRGRTGDNLGAGNENPGGDGGDSTYGFGGRGGTSDGEAGSNATGYAAGGGGGSGDDNSTPAGGAFSQGVVIVTEYF